MIRQGRQRVSKLTVEWFTDLVEELLTTPIGESRREASAQSG